MSKNDSEPPTPPTAGPPTPLQSLNQVLDQWEDESTVTVRLKPVPPSEPPHTKERRKTIALVVAVVALAVEAARELLPLLVKFLSSN